MFRRWWMVRAGAPVVIETTPRSDGQEVVFRDSASSTGFVETTPRPDGQDMVFRDNASCTGGSLWLETPPRAWEKELVPITEFARPIYSRAAYVPSGVGVRCGVVYLIGARSSRLGMSWSTRTCSHIATLGEISYDRDCVTYLYSGL